MWQALLESIRKGWGWYSATVIVLSLAGAIYYWGWDFGNGPGVPHQTVDEKGVVTTRP